MSGLNFAAIWKRVVKNQNSWVVFSHGTVVIFLPEDLQAEGFDFCVEAVERLKNLKIKDIAVAELVGQGLGWIINCGNDYILSYLPHGDYESRYDRMSEVIEVQRLDQRDLKIIHVQI